jgi:hypothetical protein
MIFIFAPPRMSCPILPGAQMLCTGEAGQPTSVGSVSPTRRGKTGEPLPIAAAKG